MKKMRNYSIICFFVIAISLCSCKTEPLLITPLEMLSRVDTPSFDGKKVSTKVDVYLVSGYDDNSKTRIAIESFIDKNKKDNFLKYMQYEMIFYKESSETNPKNIIANPRIIDRYSQKHDLIYASIWMGGKHLVTEKWKNGEIISPNKKVFVEPVPK